MNKTISIAIATGLVMVAGCATPDAGEVDPGEAQAEEEAAGMNRVISTNPVTKPDGDEVGESVLERAADGIVLNFEACCVSPGNAYTAWWVIGDVNLPMTATGIKTPQATGWVAGSEQVDLELILNAGSDGIEDPHDGVRLVVLDHGPDTGDPKQLTTPEGGCLGMCPVILRASHATP